MNLLECIVLIKVAYRCWLLADDGGNFTRRSSSGMTLEARQSEGEIQGPQVSRKGLGLTSSTGSLILDRHENDDLMTMLQRAQAHDTQKKTAARLVEGSQLSFALGKS
jgi:hypothetical protein